MNRIHALAVVVLATFAVSGCKRESEAPPAAEAAPAVAETAPAATPSAVISEVDHNSPASAAPGFDVKAFAGEYGGGGIKLAIDADGRYTLGNANSGASTQGTWTIEADGKHVLLDPESKDEADRRFEIAANGELRETDRSLALIRGG